MSESSNHKTRQQAELGEIINSNRSSKIEKQIAQAQLDQLEADKRPPPHVHKHRLQGSSGRELDDNVVGDSPIFRNDEAFERYQMGGKKAEDVHHQHANKQEKQATSDYQSIKQNHSARGRVKASAQDNLNEVYGHD